MSLLGPTLDPDDLAGRKVIALFDRAEARDYADVYALAKRYGTERLLELAASVDAGFDITVFADMLDALGRFTDDEVPAADSDVAAVRAFIAGWSADIRRRGDGGAEAGWWVGRQGHSTRAVPCHRNAPECSVTAMGCPHDPSKPGVRQTRLTFDPVASTLL